MSHEKRYEDLGFVYTDYDGPQGYEAAPGFNQGFYLGSRDQARQHKWYVLLGLIAGGLLGWLL